MADHTKYKFNGKDKLGKNRLVLEVVKHYINTHQNISYSELLVTFPDTLQGNIGVLKNEKDLEDWEKDKKDSNKRNARFFTKNDEILELNNEKIFVCTEWGSGPTENILSFIEYVKENLKYEIVEQNQPIKNKDIKGVNKMNIKNIILYGAPGVGKTHNYKKLISLIEEGKSQKDIFDAIKENELYSDTSEKYLDAKNEKRVEFITFHQSFGYEDFIEGFRPNEDGNIQLESGIFKNICFDAHLKPDKNYYLVIDEINRGNISKIFGELITLIEESKRANNSNSSYEVTLPYSKEKFKVPSNLYIIGTMNTTDKSIALIDVALRRRFTFIKMQPNPDLVENEKAKKLLIDLNEFIKNSSLGEEYQIGHSYFMNIEESDLDFVKEYKIKPLLEEYYYGDVKLKDVLKIIGLEN